MIRIKYQFYYYPDDLVTKSRKRNQRIVQSNIQKRNQIQMTLQFPLPLQAAAKPRQSGEKLFHYLVYCDKLSDLPVICFKYTSLWKCCLFFQNNEQQLILYESTPETSFTMLFTFQQLGSKKKLWDQIFTDTAPGKAQRPAGLLHDKHV